jgi:hypothetical protein
MNPMKRLAKRIFSGTVQCLLQAGWFGQCVDRLAYERWRQRRRQCEQRLRAQGLYGDEVTYGPFKGLVYPDIWASNRFEKMIGAYEHYLHGLLERLCQKPYTEVVNVGCAEGYYVVGFARRLPQAIVYGFDIESALIIQCRHIAALNGVADRVKTGAFCDPATLNAVPVRGKCLVFSDCEGYELDLLDPTRAPMLKTADILVEIHDFKNRAISRTIKERFAATHRLEVFQTESITLRNYPILQHLNFQEIYAMVGEERLELMQWFFLEALPA